MIYVSAGVLWFVAAISFASLAVASDRIRTPVAWISGFITATAIITTVVVSTP